ncbi:hypothetical protein LTR97_001659 [Elasticomyces elasticus]|uniref:Uncharacterized protein n=1 Tax=Elasticomyces elasticus TaxID=574655 RepID=A0AAN7WGE4_9PEZI|nr:hypothetical protein LTR97_001659 [Elasticomyces elasticus]
MKLRYPAIVSGGLAMISNWSSPSTGNQRQQLTRASRYKVGVSELGGQGHQPPPPVGPTTPFDDRYGRITPTWPNPHGVQKEAARSEAHLGTPTLACSASTPHGDLVPHRA